MNKEEKRLFDELLEKLEYNNQDFSIDELNHQDAHKKIFNFLKDIVEYFGCHDYLFVLGVTKLEERHGKFMLPYLYEILDNYVNFNEYFNEDIAFAAYYNIGLHYARYFEINELFDFITKNTYLEMFKNKYPLAYDGVGRYLSINGMVDRMYLLDLATIRNMKNLKISNPEYFKTTKYGYDQSGDNVAIKVGVAASICSMFEHQFVRGKLGLNLELDNVGHNKEFQVDKIKDMILSNEGYEIDESLISEETLDIGMDCIGQAIEYNPSYPKYPYLKAQLIFYKLLYKKEVVTFELYQEMKKLLEKAKSLENSKANDYQLRCSKYDVFLSRIETYMENSSQKRDSVVDYEYFKQKDEIIRMQTCPPPQKRINPTVNGDDPYAFISYSTQNFKSVYCDLLAFKRRGISFWYDAGVIPGEQWHRIVEQKIENASVIICYLSADFIKSGAIYKELSLFKKYNKPVIWVDLTGQKQISRIIIDVIRKSKVDTLNKISSNMLNVLTELLDDDIDMITREPDPQSEIHVDRIKKVIENKFPNIIHTIETSYSSVRNTKSDLNGNKTLPNEDYVICDSHNNIYIVLDGITRPKVEYTGDGKSIAYDLSKLFADTIHKYIQSNLIYCKDFKDAKIILNEGFKLANEEVRLLLEKRKEEWEGREIPGAVGIVGFIINHSLYYGSLGDCMGILVRGEQKHIFSAKQTTSAFDYLKKENSRELLYKKFVNKKDNPYGYGVIDGDPEALEYFNISYINLDRADTIYLVSDGISDLIEYCKPEIIENLSIDELVEESFRQDELFEKPFNDDKSIIRIKIDSTKNY